MCTVVHGARCLRSAAFPWQAGAFLHSPDAQSYEGAHLVPVKGQSSLIFLEAGLSDRPPGTTAIMSPSAPGVPQGMPLGEQTILEALGLHMEGRSSKFSVWGLQGHASHEEKELSWGDRRQGFVPLWVEAAPRCLSRRLGTWARLKAHGTVLKEARCPLSRGSLSAEPDPGPSLADAPWSSKCRALFPVLEELGIKYQNHSTVTVAKIDITANDIQLMHLDRYPFFRLFPTNSQQVRGSWDSRIWKSGYHFSLFQLCLLPRQPPSQLRPQLSSPLPFKVFAISFRRSPRTRYYWVQLNGACDSPRTQSLWPSG